MMRGQKLNIGLLSLFCAAVAVQGWMGNPVSAQVPPGSTNVTVTDPAMVRDGQYSASQYYGDPAEVLGERRGQRQTQQEEIRILIKEGSKVYCAWSNQLLHNDVTFQEVPPEQAQNYYDDGTHHDEIPFDGLPSRVYINNAEYLSPYAIAIKEKLIRLKEKVLLLEDSIDPGMQEWLDTQQELRVARKLKENSYERSESKPAMWNEMGLWDPLRFYAGLQVVSLDRKTELPKFVEKLRDQTVFMQVFDENVIDRFRGYEYYPDEENPEWERALWAEIEPESKDVRDYWGFDEQQELEEQQQFMGMQGMGMGMDPSMMGGPMPGMY